MECKNRKEKVNYLKCSTSRMKFCNTDIVILMSTDRKMLISVIYMYLLFIAFTSHAPEILKHKRMKFT